MEVTQEDQAKINEFSKLHTRQTQHDAALARLRQDKEYLDDVALELELTDEDDVLPYKVGGVFVSLPVSEVNARLLDEQAALDQRIEARSSEVADDEERMRVLKGELYSKFGTAINLEKD